MTAPPRTSSGSIFVGVFLGEVIAVAAMKLIPVVFNGTGDPCVVLIAIWPPVESGGGLDGDVVVVEGDGQPARIVVRPGYATVVVHAGVEVEVARAFLAGQEQRRRDGGVGGEVVVEDGFGFRHRHCGDGFVQRRVGVSVDGEVVVQAPAQCFGDGGCGVVPAPIDFLDGDVALVVALDAGVVIGVFGAFVVDVLAVAPGDEGAFQAVGEEEECGIVVEVVVDGGVFEDDVVVGAVILADVEAGERPIVGIGLDDLGDVPLFVFGAAAIFRARADVDQGFDDPDETHLVGVAPLRCRAYNASCQRRRHARLRDSR